MLFGEEEEEEGAHHHQNQNQDTVQEEVNYFWFCDYCHTATYDNKNWFDLKSEMFCFTQRASTFLLMVKTCLH